MLTVMTDKNSVTRRGARWRSIRDLRSRDTALLTPDPDEGAVGARGQAGVHVGWRLPGTFLWKGERLADAVRRPADQGGGRGPAPHQLRVFDDPSATIAAGYVGGALGRRPSRPPGSRFETDTRLVPVGSPGRPATTG